MGDKQVRTFRPAAEDSVSLDEEWLERKPCAGEIGANPAAEPIDFARLDKLGRFG